MHRLHIRRRIKHAREIEARLRDVKTSCRRFVPCARAMSGCSSSIEFPAAPSIRNGHVASNSKAWLWKEGTAAPEARAGSFIWCR